MFKVFGFLTKREGMHMQDFIDYYENNHVPLIRSRAPIPRIYKRRYLIRDDELTKQGGVVDFDVNASSTSSSAIGCCIDAGVELGIPIKINVGVPGPLKLTRSLLLHSPPPSNTLLTCSRLLLLGKSILLSPCLGSG